jgi:hypothetical protein
MKLGLRHKTEWWKPALALGGVAIGIGALIFVKVREASAKSAVGWKIITPSVKGELLSTYVLPIGVKYRVTAVRTDLNKVALSTLQPLSDGYKLYDLEPPPDDWPKDDFFGTDAIRAEGTSRAEQQVAMQGAVWTYR